MLLISYPNNGPHSFHLSIHSLSFFLFLVQYHSDLALWCVWQLTNQLYIAARTSKYDLMVTQFILAKSVVGIKFNAPPPHCSWWWFPFPVKVTYLWWYRVYIEKTYLGSHQTGLIIFDYNGARYFSMGPLVEILCYFEVYLKVILVKL